MATVLKQTEADAREHCVLDDGGMIVRLGKVPWTRLAAPGLEGICYKIMNIDDSRSYCVLLNTFDPGWRFKPHKHMGDVEIYMISGSFFYENGIVHEGEYMLEAGGVTHAPATDEGALMITILHGPLQMVGPDGAIEATVGIDEFYGLAKANNAVAHLSQRRHPSRL
jgi:2,4'-dihydroxyacetophenone dioxygenase